MTAKQIKYFGTKRQKAALKAKRKRAAAPAKQNKRTAKRHRVANRTRRNCADGEFPIGRMVPVEAMRVNQDGSINVIISDSKMPGAVVAPEAMNRRRVRKR